jgi:hypothetical protein
MHGSGKRPSHHLTQPLSKDRRTLRHPQRLPRRALRAHRDHHEGRTVACDRVRELICLPRSLMNTRNTLHVECYAGFASVSSRASPQLIIVQNWLEELKRLVPAK